MESAGILSLLAVDDFRAGREFCRMGESLPVLRDAAVYDAPEYFFCVRCHSDEDALLFPLAGIAAKIVIDIVPSGFHDYMDGATLPVGVDNVSAGQVAEVLAVVGVRPQAHG